MRSPHMALALTLTLGAWLLPVAAAAESKLATLNVKGMVCQA